MEGSAAVGEGARTLQLRRGEAAPAALEKLKDVAKGFDAIFANTMLGELMKPAFGAGMGGTGPGASVIQGMIEQNLADHLGKAGGFGIGKLIVESMAPLLAAQPVAVRDLQGLAATHGEGGSR